MVYCDDSNKICIVYHMYVRSLISWLPFAKRHLRMCSNHVFIYMYSLFHVFLWKTVKYISRWIMIKPFGGENHNPMAMKKRNSTSVQLSGLQAWMDSCALCVFACNCICWGHYMQQHAFFVTLCACFVVNRDVCRDYGKLLPPAL